MKKKNKNVEVNGVEIEVVEEAYEIVEEGYQDTEVVLDGEESEAVEEIEETEELGDSEEEEAMDWREARDKLKELNGSVGWSIEEYDKRLAVESLKDRFNQKERTVQLYNAIMSL